MYFHSEKVPSFSWSTARLKEFDKLSVDSLYKRQEFAIAKALVPDLVKDIQLDKYTKADAKKAYDAISFLNLGKVELRKFV
jgi:hypothetical protein